MLTCVKLVKLPYYDYICKTSVVNNMNLRLQQFLKAMNISQSHFADTIGVARANVSHIIAGRNKPGFDFLLRMSKHYPSLNLEWLITGKGSMVTTIGLFDQTEETAPVPAPTPAAVQTPSPGATAPSKSQGLPESNIPEQKPVVHQISNSRAISKIIVFYDDGSYQELK